MSWLARSIANTLKFDDTIDNHHPPNDDVSDSNEEDPTNKGRDSIKGADQDSPSPAPSPRGVKDDLSQLTKTLTRQFWGVASFLAPLPQPDSGDPDHNRDSGSESDPAGIMGIRHDFAEIGGKFRTGISMISNNVAVSEITKMASNFLQLGSDNEEEEAQGDNSTMGAVGVTDEVVSFARDIAMHPETWLDFPLTENGDGNDFDMSDAQQEHALAVERLAPRLAALRMELCPGYMSEACFWKIYFVLLHPRLEKKDTELLATPQIVKARASLSHELKSRTKQLDGEDNFDVENISSIQNEELLSALPRTNHENVPATFVTESATSAAAAKCETEKQPVRRIEIQSLDRPAIQETYLDRKDQNSLVGSSNVPVVKDEDDTDDWLKEESSEVAGAHGGTISVENEEDVSFSDLEEDDGDVPSTLKKASYNSDKDTPDWVQL